MIRGLVDFAVRRPWTIHGFVVALIVGGLIAFESLPFEAFPDLTANSVTVIADAPGRAPQDVEQLVTFPIERSLLGLPRTESVRSTTKYGLSMTSVIFSDGVDPWFARQVVSERLGNLAGDLPEGVTVALGPVATAMGEIYQYVLRSTDGSHSLADLKTLQDYSLAPQLRTIEGVAEVNSWGGETEQYHVVLEPGRLREAGIPLGDVADALAANNRNFGGTYVESRGERFVVRGEGRFGAIEELGEVVVGPDRDVPIRVRDLGTVQRGALPRQGAVTLDGGGEVVAGMVIMRKGANALRVLEGVEARIEEVRPTLPPGVDLVVFYNQGELVEQTTHTVEKNLLLGGTLVVLLLWGFLRNIAASVLVALVIPLSMLWAFISMRVFGFSANLMSLGALDFGLLVDASVVIVENVMRKAEEGGEAKGPIEARGRVRRAVLEVGRPVVFGIAIILSVYLPILALQGTEGRMFRPMAFTVVAAILGSLLLALTFVPAASAQLLRNAREPDTPMFDRMRDRYRDLLARVVQRPVVVLGTAVSLLVVSLWGATQLGTEFMPRLDEGSVLVQGVRPASTALADGSRLSAGIEATLLELPEVDRVVSKLGRPDLATEAMGTYESDTYVTLRPRSEWRPGGKDALLDAMDARLSAVPGIEFAFTQPIQMRLDEAETGITTDVGVKIFGDDPDVLASLAGRVEQALIEIEGASEVRVSAAARVREVQIDVDRPAAARFGLSAEDVGMQVEMALGSAVATSVVDGPRRIGVVVRLPEGITVDPDRMEHLPIRTARGATIDLASVADLTIVESPEAFAHEGGQRLVVVGANIRGRDTGSFVEEASVHLGETIPLGAGYRFEWGGQYQNQQSAMRRLALLLPIAIGAIYVLLFSTFHSTSRALLVMLNLPFAIIGGVAALAVAGLTVSTSALIGFIAVFGIAVLNGVVMVSYIEERRRSGASTFDAVIGGAAVRLRPVLMTALAASLGFLPMALSTSPGAELQRPLATVVIGGLLSATVLTLFVLPTLYVLFSGERGSRGRA